MTDSTSQVAERLRKLATDVRRIGDGWSQDPETVAIQKDDVARSLISLARELEHE